MKSFIGPLVFVLTVFLSACVTIAPNKDKDKWDALVSSEDFKKEKEVYTSKMGGLYFCWGIGVDSFLTNASPKPDPKCIYPASHLEIGLDDGTFVKQKTLNQALNQLRVLQVTPEGFVVESSNRSNSQVIFIYKTNETGIVDGSYLDQTNWVLYEYAGTYSYKALLGSKTVQSFKKIARERHAKALEGLKTYNPWKELYVTNQLWDHLETMEKGSTEK